MPTPVINYAGQPYTAGASWQTNNAGNFGTQEVTDFTNSSGVTLYTGDVVVLGFAATIPDVTGFQVTTTTAVSSPYVIGVVGGMTNMASAGGPIPFVTPASRIDIVSPTGTTTTNDANAVAADVGKSVTGVGVPANTVVTTVSAGVSITTNNSIATGTNVAITLGPIVASIGPGWQTTPSFPPGSIVPVVMAGWGYVNVGGNTVAAGNLLTTSGTARVGSAVTSAALLIGTFIGVCLEAQNATGTITSGDGSASRLVRAWITKF